MFHYSQVNTSHAGLSLILETKSDNVVQNQQLRGFVIHNTGDITCWLN